MYTTKSRGPTTEPRGTPQDTDWAEGREPEHLAEDDLDERYFAFVKIN